MNSFWLAFSTVCPLLLLMSLGAVLRRVGLFTNDFLARLNALCFRVFLPAVLFQNVYGNPFDFAADAGLLAYAAGAILVAFVVLYLVVPRLEKRRDRRGVIIQGGFRSNIVLFGLPISNTLFGADHAGTVAVLIAFVVPLFNVLSVIALERHRGERVKWSKMVGGIAKNPLVIAGVAGIIFAATGVRFPSVVDAAVLQVAQVATPLALIALGGSFSFSQIKANGRPLFWTVACKLVVLPAVFLGLAVALGYRGVELGALLALFASPAAVSSFPMAEELGGDGELAGQIVAVGSAVSIVTLFAAVSVLGVFGWL
ncbi:MAG: AEC family transporter [Gordonibacter sp.]